MTSLTKTTRGWKVVVAAVLAAGLSASLPTVRASHATYRGQNGRLVFQANVGPGKAAQLFTINPDGTGLVQVTHFKTSGASEATWSKDGSRIVFSRHWDPMGPNEKLVVYTMNPDGTSLKALPRSGKIAVTPNWFPNGRRIVFLDAFAPNGGRPMVIRADGTGLRSAGLPASSSSFCFLGNTSRVAFLRSKPDQEDQAAVFVAGLFGHGLKRITPWGGYADKIDCSPDGTRIVYSAPAFGQDGKSSNVYTMRAEGSDVVQLTHETGGTVNDGADSWSPDGSRIAYVSNKAGMYQIWTMNTDGSDPKQLTTGPEAHSAAWGPRL